MKRGFMNEGCKMIMRLLMITWLGYCILACQNFSKSNLENVSAIPAEENPNEEKYELISAPLLKILDILHVDHGGTFQNIVDKTQKLWLRPEGKERWQIEEVEVENREQLISLFDELGLIKSLFPSKTHYHYAVLLGGTLEGVRNRLGFLIQLWNRGLRFDQLVFLTGDRTLDQEIEAPEKLLSCTNKLMPCKVDWEWKGELPKNETGMIYLVYDQAELPESLRKIPFVVVDAPMSQLEDGKKRRPSTADTVIKWLQMNPQPADVLAISNQPLIKYQNAVLHQLMPKEFILETVGRGDELEQVKMTIYLDSLARWLYVEGKAQMEK